MLSLNSSMNEGSAMARSKVSVYLNQGLADQKEWVFERQFSIGRDSTADVCINDPTVSRFHAFVHLVGGAWWIRDMNSSNGTYINEKKVTQYPMDDQTKLQLGADGPTLHLQSDNPYSSDSGTVIVDLSAFKKDETSCCDLKNGEKKNIAGSGNAVARKNDSGFVKTLLEKWFINSPVRRKIALIAASLIWVGLILAGYAYLQEDRNSAKKQQAINIAENQTDSEKVRRSGIGKADTQKREENIHTDQVTQPSVPYRKIGPIRHAQNNSTDLQQHMIRNHTADIYFNAAKKFFAHHRWEAALTYYQKVSEINPDYSQLNTEIAKVKFEIDNQAAYKKAMAHLNEKRYEQCITVLGNFPENSVYYQEVEKLIVEAENKREQASEEQKKKEAEELKAAQEQNAIGTINEALRYYAEGKIKSAVNILNRVVQSPTPGIADLKKRAGSLKKDIGYATSLFRKGDQAYTSGQIDAALSTWTTLLKIEQKLLGHKKGHFSGRVRQKMADEYGAMALKEYLKGDFPGAYRHSKLALSQKGNQPKALEVKKMLKTNQSVSIRKVTFLKHIILKKPWKNGG